MDISAVEVVYEVYGVVDISDNTCILIYGAGILATFYRRGNYYCFEAARGTQRFHLAFV